MMEISRKNQKKLAAEEKKKDCYEAKNDWAIAMDFTFFESIDVYGLPEHTTRLNLPEFDEPYRFWNSDVFEYALNDPMAIYGGVPIIWSLASTGTTSAVLWINAADTW
eukprot:Trichotokara_eunicae@DN6524_c0_g1_i1.p1